MTAMTLLLLAKIIVTALLVAIPMLVMPMRKLEARLRVTAAASTLFRLYGVSTLALLVAYGFGIASAQLGEYPWGVATMGVVSNGGAVIVLLTTGAASRAKLPCAFFGFVTVGLLASMAAPSGAVTALF